MSQWEAKWVGHWDKAVRKSDALRAALCRHLRVEMAIALGASVVEVFYDCEKFYDSISPELVARAGIALEYPPGLLYLGLVMHMAPKVLRHKGAYSLPVLASKGILVGCMQSVTWTRVFLWEMLDFAHKQFKPVKIESWVDDLVLLAIGSSTQVPRLAADASLYVTKELARRGCTVSPTKTCYMASSRHVGWRFARRVAIRGRTFIKKAASVRDLGVNACMRQRRIGIGMGRRKAATARGKVIKRFTKHAAQATKLVKTGWMPQATWGAAVSGLAPSTQLRLRGQLAEISGHRKAGGCSTTTIRLTFGRRADPLVQLKVDLLVAWARVLMTEGVQKWQRVWQWWKERLVRKPVARRWRRIGWARWCCHRHPARPWLES